MPGWLGLPIAVPLVAAFLIEAALYLASGFEAVRERLRRLRRPVLALAMTASAAVPYLAYAVPAGVFEWRALAALLGLASALSCWYVVLPIKTALALSWMVAGFIEMVVAGLVVALVYKP